MPIHKRLDHGEQVLRTTVSGAVTFSDVREHLGAVRRAGESRYPELIDATGAAAGVFSRRDLLELAHQARQAFGDDEAARRAVVVRSQDDFSMARTFASLVAGWVRVGVFDDTTAAEDWLKPIAS